MIIRIGSLCMHRYSYTLFGQCKVTASAQMLRDNLLPLHFFFCFFFFLCLTFIAVWALVMVSGGYSLVSVHGLLIAVTSLVADHGL